MKNFEKINYEEVLTNALNHTINYAKEKGIIDKPKTKKFLDNLTKSTKETIESIQIIQNHNYRISKLNKLGFKEESIILTVTIFEVLMKDFFWKSKDDWFNFPSHRFSELSPDEKVDLRKKIQKYLKEIKLFDEYLKDLYLYPNTAPDAEIKCLYETLLKNERKINFQNLKDKNGVKNTYLTFLDIDISKCLNPDLKISLEKWNLLNQLIKERHDIIHKGKKTSLTEDQILEILNSINSITHCIVRKKFVSVKSNWEKAISIFEHEHGIKLTHK